MSTNSKKVVKKLPKNCQQLSKGCHKICSKFQSGLGGVGAKRKNNQG
jgi:hypothetical protein